MGIVLVLLLSAFALRVYRLDHHELRGDEAATYVYSIRSFAELLEIWKVDSLPPLYYSIMHGWFRLAGTTEFAIRYVSVAGGLLLVASVTVLGRKLSVGQAGILAGLLVAVNPYEIYYAQDARPYPLATWLGVLSTFVLWQALHRPSPLAPPCEDRGLLKTGDYRPLAKTADYRNDPPHDGGLRRALRPHNRRGLRPPWRDWTIYGLLTLVLAYTHYYFFVIVAFQGMLVVRDAWRHRRVPWRYVVVGTAAGMLYLPWLAYTWELMTNYRGYVESVGLIASLGRPLLAFAGGQLLSPPITWVNGVVVWPLLAVGVVGLWQMNRRACHLATLYLLVPLVLVFFVSQFRPLFSERYLALASPAFFLLIGAGLTWSLRQTRVWLIAGSAVGAITLLATGGVALANYYTNPAFAKSPPWRDILGYIDRKSQPGDELVYTSPMPEILYYNERAGRSRGTRAGPPLPASLIPYEEDSPVTDAVKGLKDTLVDHPRVWLIPLPANQDQVASHVEPWLDRHSARLDQVFFRVVHIGLYQSPTEFLQTMTVQPSRFAQGASQDSVIVQMEGFRFGKKASSPFTIAPGEPVPLTLVWRATQRPTTDYTVFTHVIAPDGGLWGQWDNPPVWGTYPTTQWTAGETVFDQYLIPLKQDAPSGTYHVIVGLYDLASGARLFVLDDHGRVTGDGVQLSQPLVVRAEGQ